MRYRNLLQLLLLAEVSDDYEDVDHILENVSARAGQCQILVQLDVVSALLVDLVTCNLVRAYSLSTTSAPVEVPTPLDPEQLKDYYFWITEKGKDLLRSSREQLPFDEEGELLPGWSPEGYDE